MTEAHTAPISSAMRMAAAESLLPESVRASFSQMADQDVALAERQLSTYVDEATGGAVPFKVSLHALPGENHTKQLVAECVFSGPVHPELEETLIQALQAHPVLGDYHPTLHHNGQGCFTVTTLGMSALDYTNLIRTLAELQHEYDTYENTTGTRHEDAFHVHEKMQTAAESLKLMVEQQIKDAPVFALKPEKSKCKKTGLYTLDLRLEGQMDRAQAYPVMGALVNAFRRKRRAPLSAAHEEKLAVHDRLLRIEGLTKEAMDGLIDDLAKPFTQVGQVLRLGAVQDTAVETGIGQGGMK